MKIGISEIIFPHLPLEDFFSIAAKAGYDVVELCLGGVCPLQLKSQEEDVALVNKLAARYQLPEVSLVHWQCTGNLLAGGEEQEKGIEQTCKGLEIAQKIGAQNSLHTLGRLSSDLYYDEAYGNIIMRIEELP